MRRALGIGGRILGYAVLTLVLLVASTLLTSILVGRSEWGRRKILSLALPALRAELAGRLSIGRIGGSLTHGLVLEDVRVDDVEGKPCIRVRRVAVDYEPLSLLSRVIDLTSVRIEGGWVRARTLADGRLNLAALTKPSPANQAPSSSPGYRVRVRRLVADLEGRYDPAALGGRAHLEGRGLVDGGKVDVGLAALSIATSAPLAATLDATGEIHVEGGAISAHALRFAVASEGKELRKLARTVALRGRYRVEVSADGPADRLRVGVRARPPAGLVRVDATVDTRAPLTWRGSFEANRIDPGAAVAGAPRGTVAFSGRARGEAGKATLEFARIAAVVVGVRLLAHGRLISDGRADFWAALDANDLSTLAPLGLRGIGGRMHARTRIERSGTRHHVDVDLRGEHLRYGGRTLHALDLHVHEINFEGEAHAHARGLAAGVTVDSFDLDVAGGARGIKGRLLARGPHQTSAALLAHGTPKRLVLDALTLQKGAERIGTRHAATLDLDGGVDLRRLELFGRKTEIALDARYWQKGGRVAAHLRARHLSVAESIALLKNVRGVPASNLDLDLDLGGTTKQPRLEARLEGSLTLVTAGGPEPFSAHLVAHYADERARAEWALKSKSESIEGRAEVPVPMRGDHPLAARLEVRDLSLADLGQFLPPSVADLEGHLDASLALSGTTARPVIKVALHGVGVRAPGRVDRLDLDAVAEYAGERARLALVSRLRGALALSLRAETELDLPRALAGGVDRNLPLHVDAEVPGFDLARVPELAASARGRLDARAQIRGTLAQPRGVLDATVTGFTLSDFRYDRFEAHGRLEERVVRAALDAKEQDGGTLAVEAKLPLDPKRPLWAGLEAHRFHFGYRRHAAGGLRLISALLDASVRASGVRAHPSVEGELHVQQGQLAVGSDPRGYKNIAVDASLHHGWLAIDKVQAHTGDGRLDANGGVALDGLTPTKVDLRAYARHFPIPTGSFGTWLDANVTVHGEKRGGALAGTVVVDKGSAKLPKLATGRSLQKTGPLDDVRFVDAAARHQAQKSAPPSSPGPPARIEARIPGPFHVRGKELSVDFAGDLVVDAGAETRISGEVKSLGGWFELLGRRYAVDKARLGFGGESEIDPTLDVRLTRDLEDTTIIIEVHGTAKEPQLVLASDPPIYEQSEIIAAILSGDPKAQRVDERRLDQKVTGAISSLLVNKIKDQIAPNLPIDVIKVETGSTGATGLTDTRIEVGKYITETVYLSYVHQFGATQFGTQRVNANEGTLDWRFARHYDLETAFGDAAVGRINLSWTLRF